MSHLTRNVLNNIESWSLNVRTMTSGIETEDIGETN